MGDLISRKALISRIESEYKQWGEDYDAEQVLGDIEDFPTAFDLESVITKIKAEEKRQLIELEETLKNTDVDNQIVFLTYNAVLVTLDSIMALIKSATNGKIGG